jgi:hypothetical protein
LWRLCLIILTLSRLIIPTLWRLCLIIQSRNN